HSFSIAPRNAPIGLRRGAALTGGAGLRPNSVQGVSTATQNTKSAQSGSVICDRLNMHPRRELLLHGRGGVPAAELVEDRRSRAPVGILASVHDDLGQLVPLRDSLVSLSLERLGDAKGGRGEHARDEARV